MGSDWGECVSVLGECVSVLGERMVWGVIGVST